MKWVRAGASVSPQGFCAVGARIELAMRRIPLFDNKKAQSRSLGLYLVEIRGFEPLTYTMRTYRSTN